MSVDSLGARYRRRRPLELVIVTGLVCAWLAALGTRAAEASSSAPERDLIRLLDGSVLHGALESIDVKRGVGWRHPEATQLIELGPTNLALIRFALHALEPLPAKPTCRFRFVNGDEVFGNPRGMDASHLELDAWFGTRLKVPRQSLSSIILLAKGFVIRYEGPTGIDDWRQPAQRAAWSYHNGALTSSSVGILGRDLGLAESSSIEFDLGWTGQFNLVLKIYSEITERLEYLYNQSSYMLFFSPGFVTLQRVQAGAGTVQLGYAQVPQMQNRNPVHIELRTSKEDATIALWVNSELVQRWKDASGFVGRGSGLVLYNQMDGATVRLSNLKVSEWDVRLEAAPSELEPGTNDVLHLVNRDVVKGTLESLANDKIRVAVAETRLDIPLDRVTRVFFAAPTQAPSAPGPWAVRAHFRRGGNLSMQLDAWRDASVLGTSPLFGAIRLPAGSIRRLSFNWDRSAELTDEGEVGGDEIWDFHE